MQELKSPPPNSGGACRRKQFPPRTDGRCSFICPRNSCVKEGRACVDEIGDCACKQGFQLDAQSRLCIIDTSKCIRTPPKGSPGCQFKCPQHSCIKAGHGCVDGIEDCVCSDGYIMDTPNRGCIPSNLNPQNRPLRLGVAPVIRGESNDMTGPVRLVGAPPTLISSACSASFNHGCQTCFHASRSCAPVVSMAQSRGFDDNCLAYGHRLRRQREHSTELGSLVQLLQTMKLGSRKVVVLPLLAPLV